MKDVKKTILYTSFLTLLFSLSAQASDCTAITGRFPVAANDVDKSSYKVTMGSCVHMSPGGNATDVVSLRSFKLRGEVMNWVVNSKTLQTAIVPEKCLQSCTQFNSKDSTKYATLLTEATTVPSPVENAGVQKAKDPQATSTFLTVDLCPSSKTLQTEIFERIQSGYMTNVPVALAVSGLWIQRHHEEFVYLLKLQEQKKIRITWVNHSLTHPYDKTKGIADNFLLTPGIDFQREVLGNELVMLGQGLVPSVFFRFPGLVSSDKLINQLKAWGLVPLGSNAWLGKGQKIKNGSVVLIHGNGNELSGLALLYKALEIKPEINSQWLDLNRVWISVTDTVEVNKP